MYQSQSALLKDIDSLRKKMIACARETGYTSEETIRCSQELDLLIFHYQNIRKNSRINKQKGKFIFRKMIFTVKKQCGFAGA